MMHDLERDAEAEQRLAKFLGSNHEALTYLSRLMFARAERDKLRKDRSVWGSFEFHCIACDFSHADYLTRHKELGQTGAPVGEKGYALLKNAFNAEMDADLKPTATWPFTEETK